MSEPRLSYLRVIRLSVPVMMAQAAIAATGVVDTAVMGLAGTKADLAAIAIASSVFSFLYWGFGFLRMSTTGLVAQAQGRGDASAARAVVQRALCLGLALGLLLLVVAPFVRTAVFFPFGATASVNGLGQAYFDARIWGAPALLMSYGITGWLLGTGRTGALLAMQLVMNGVNVGLDAWFVLGLGWGPAGIGAGTAIAEWAALLLGLLLIRGSLKPERGLGDRQALGALFGANRDVLIRTLAMLFCFAWFVRSGTQLGTATLAGNQILLQFIAVSAFILDGFAFVAEKEVGEAFGARRRDQLVRAMQVTSILAFGFACGLALLYAVCGAWLINDYIRDPEAREVALGFLPYCAIVPVLGVVAYQLDGFLLGATRGQALRTAALIVVPFYVGLDLWLRPALGNQGVWLAFLGMFVVRGLSHGAFVPGLLAETNANQPQRPLPRS